MDIKSLFSPVSAFLSPYTGLIRIGLYLCLAAALIMAGWTVQGWRKDAVIAELKADIANTRADSNKIAYDDLFTATTNMQNAALAYTKATTDLTTQINVIKKDIKAYAKTNPLKPDCRPDAPRMQSLTDAISKANASTH